MSLGISNWRIDSQNETHRLELRRYLRGWGVAPEDTFQVENEVMKSLALTGNLYFHCKTKITANLLFWGFYV